MNINKLLLLSFLSAPLLFSQTKTLPAGWSLNGLGQSEGSFDPASLPTGVSTVWKFDADSKSWKAYSPNELTKTTLTNAGITELESIKPGDGFWINSTQEVNLTSSTQNAKVIVSNYSVETDLSKTENKDYTYNYVQGSGVALAEYIDWDQAVSLSAADDPTLAKTLYAVIPKVFKSTNNTHILVVNSFNCGSNDYTIAVTPYQTDASIPGTSQNYWNDTIPLDFDIIIPTSQPKTGLNSYTTGNSYIINTPIRELSSDISISNSSGERLSLEDASQACTIDAYMIYDLDDFSIPENSLSLYQVNGFDDFQMVSSVSLTQNTYTGKISTNSIISNFSPVVITSTKTVNEFMVYDSTLDMTNAPFMMVRYPTVNTGITYSVNSISSTAMPDSALLSQKISDDGMELVKSFEITFDGVNSQYTDEFTPQAYFYFTNADMKQYKLYAYDGSTYIPVIADQSTLDSATEKTVYHSGPFSSQQMKFALAKPTTLNNQTYMGSWAQYSGADCLASGGILELSVKSDVIFGTAVVGSTIMGITGMPVSGSSFSGYTADGTYWQGSISSSTISGQFTDYEYCYGSFSVSK